MSEHMYKCASSHKGDTCNSVGHVLPPSVFGFLFSLFGDHESGVVFPAYLFPGHALRPRRLVQGGLDSCCERGAAVEEPV